MVQDLTSLKVSWSGSTFDTGLRLHDSGWHHVALVLRFTETGFDLKVYLDGRPSANGRLIHDRGVRLQSGDNFVLARRFGNELASPFSGEMSAFGVWKRAFEDADIRSLVELEEPPADGLEIFWRLDKNPPGIQDHAPDVVYVPPGLALADDMSRILSGQIGFFPLSKQLEIEGLRQLESLGRENKRGPNVDGTFSIDATFDPDQSGPLAAAVVSGSAGHLNLKLSSDADLLDAPDGFTYNLWLRLDSQQSPGRRAILSPVLRLVNGRIVFNIHLKKSSSQLVTEVNQLPGTPPFPLNKWVHLVATYNHATTNIATVFLDGEPVSVQALDNVGPSDQLLPMIPTKYQVGETTEPFDGLIGQVGVYDKPVTGLGVLLLRQQASVGEFATPESDLMKRMFGQDDLDRRYDEVIFLMAHNAYANAEDDWFVTQQNRSVTFQLERLGVRALELDVFPFDNGDGRGVQLYLCHGGCSGTLPEFIGPPPKRLRLFSETLVEVARFLDANPDQVVTIFVEWGQERHNQAGNNLVLEVLQTRLNKEDPQSKKVLDFVFWPDRTESTPENTKVFNVNPSEGVFNWPTIGKMVESNKRLVIFVDKLFGEKVEGKDGPVHVFPFVWRYIRETNFPTSLLDGFPNEIPIASGEGERDQSVDVQRDRTMVRWNWFPLFSLGTAYSIQNRLGRLLIAAQLVAGKMRQVPNFLAMDFVEVGGGMELVARINQKCWSQPSPLFALIGLKLNRAEQAIEDNILKELQCVFVPGGCGD
jgi:hypothetical protein